MAWEWQTAFTHAYGIGYFYGRQHGDEEPGREELTERFGPSDETNLAQYAGFKAGYADGVNDYVWSVDGEPDPAANLSHEALVEAAANTQSLIESGDYHVEET